MLVANDLALCTECVKNGTNGINSEVVTKDGKHKLCLRHLIRTVDQVEPSDSIDWRLRLDYPPDDEVENDSDPWQQNALRAWEDSD